MFGSGTVALTRARGFGSLPVLLEDRAGEASLFRALESEGLPVGVLEAPDTPIPLNAMMSVFARAGRLLGDRTFGLDVGERMTHRGYGLWVEHCILAADLGAALRRSAATVWAHQTQCKFKLVDAGPHVLWSYEPPSLAAMNHQYIDHIIPAMLEVVRLYLGKDWVPDWIEVNYSRDADAAQMESRLKIPIRFGRKGLAIALRREELGRRRNGTLSDASRVVTLREVVADAVLADAPEPARSLSAIVALRLLDGDSDIDGTARLAGLSVRGMQRRLQQKGYTYSDLLAAARRDRAIRLLLETELPLLEIALILGYENHESFTRAFRHWLGCAPSDYRRQCRPR